MFESKFHPDMEKLKEPENIGITFEVMRTPKIFISEEQGAQTLSLILKAKNSEWGSLDNSFAEETKKYFEDNPLNQDVSGFLDEIHALQEGGVDEEALYTLALTYGHPERNEEAFEVLTRYKSYVKNPQELQQKLFRALEIFQRSFSLSPLAKKMAIEIEKDEGAQRKTLAETRARIAELINFFKPSPKTTRIKRIVLMPTDPLYKKDSGAAFVFGEELVLKNHRENPDGLDHEFLHSIINPIVEKLSQQLTDGQKDKIPQLASGGLKQDYGEDYFSLLCEELIRTYNDVFKRGEKPQSYEDFVRKISGVTEDQFQESLTQSENLRARCGALGITTVEYLKNKSQEYFERFEKNQLRDLIFNLYQEYSNRPNQEIGNFEQFILTQLAVRI